MTLSDSRYAYLLPEWEAVKPLLRTSCGNLNHVLLPGALAPLEDVFLSHSFLWTSGCFKQEQLWAPDHYPVARRILEQWKTDFINYINHFLEDLAFCFFSLSDLLPPRLCGRINRISGSISDIHNGRFVMMLETEHGGQFFYKPTLQNTDEPWQLLLNYLADAAGLPHFPVPRRIPGRNGSFVELIHHRSVSREEDFAQYFYKCGFLLGAAYLTGATDLHAENLIADGCCPVLIDTETICAAVWPQIALAAPDSSGRGLDNVLAAALLPFLVPGRTIRHGTAAFTDTGHDTHNLPHLDNATRTGRSYAAKIQDGFDSACTQIRHASVDFGDILRQFDRCRYRCLLRGTAYYDTLLHILASPDFLKSEEQFERKAGSLLGTNLAQSTAPQFTSVIHDLKKQELLAVKKGYIPLILDNSRQYSSRWLPSSILQRRICVCFPRNTMRQKRMISAVLPGHFTTDGSRTLLTQQPPQSLTADKKSRIQSFLFREIHRISTVLTRDTPVGFLAERYENRIYLGALTSYMPETMLGYALAAGAWYAVTGDLHTRTALLIFAKKLQNSFQSFHLSAYDEGMAEGIGGFLRAVTLLSDFTGFAEFRQLKQDALDTILDRAHSPSDSYSPWYYSLCYGKSASLLALSLLSPDQITPRITQKMEEYAKSLCSCPLPSLPSGFQGLVSGVSGALAAIRAASPFLPKPLSGKAFRLWESLPDSERTCTVGYCLCQLMSGEYPESILRVPLVQNQSYLYGNAGLLEALIEASPGFHKADLMEKAWETADTLSRQFADSAASVSHFPFPSFFYGDGGILYTMIRLLDPARVPSFLIPDHTRSK